MNYNGLVDEVTKREGKKESLSRAQVLEVLAVVSDIYFEEHTIEGRNLGVLLFNNGMRRARIKAGRLLKKNEEAKSGKSSK